jgi:hypothetical protein
MDKSKKGTVKQFWDENKRVIKTGLVCGGLGIMYGFIKGFGATSELYLKYGTYTLQTETECKDNELEEIVETEKIEE